MSDEIDLIKILCSSYLILILKAKSLTLYITAVHNIFKLFTFLYTLLINHINFVDIMEKQIKKLFIYALVIYISYIVSRKII